MSRGIRDIIQAPQSGRRVKLTVTVTNVNEITDYIDRIDGTVVDELPLDTLQVRVPETQVDNLKRHRDIEGISVASGTLRFADEGNS